MALGAFGRRLLLGLLREVTVLSAVSSFAGILAGFSFVWLLWKSFRIFITDSTQMALKLDFKCLYLSALFFVIVVLCSCLIAYKYQKRTDISEFRNYWRYMPKSHILDKTDFARTFSVFLMMFLFIAIICSLAAMIFSYTRCMTIALNNRYVFGDLKRLGASPAFLLKEIKGQASPVFKIPVTVGMTAMYFLYMLLLIGNDGRLTRGKIGGMAVCFCILTALAAVYYLVYRYTVKSMWGQCGC